MNSCSSSRCQNFPICPDPITMNTCLVWGSSCRMPSTTRRGSINAGNSGVVVAKGRAASKTLIYRRQQQRRVGKRSAVGSLRANTAAGPPTVTIRSGFGRAAKVART